MDRIVFLGTGGSRRVMARQILSTGGFILEMNDTMMSIDPGPGAIVRAAQEEINVDYLDGVLISHRHLDHCGDANVMTEAMTCGGYWKKGVVFAPGQAIYEDSVILKYLWDYVGKVQVIEEGKAYRCGNVDFETSMAHMHGEAETYGFIFRGEDYKLAYMSDTRYFEELSKFYSSDICIFSTVLVEPGRAYHLSLPDIEKLVEVIKPSTAILTHFGMYVLDLGVDNAADRIRQATGINTIAAKDGMSLNLRELL
ncbi:MAG: MBL fold metallo-hydrolase [Clostridia bacterium]|nr:MBL fold metallo-hydrolase [Clostridia bacterium]